VEFRRWEYESERSLLDAFDIGIMPLPATDQTAGKAGYKLLQYMALGIPSVASPIGINREILVEGETGFLAGDAATWQDRLATLVRDPSLRARLGAAAREAVQCRYSVDALFPRWRSLLEGALRAGPVREEHPG
jgi:glycosyltransferase involved in cell wall biosynthesis